MTIGEGILWSTLILVAFASILLLTKHKRWRAFFKGFGIFVVVCALIAIAIWAYYKYEERPQLMTSLNGINLGMKEVDITLTKGKPDEVSKIEPATDGFKKWLVYKSYDDSYTYVILRGPKDSMVATNICDSGGYGRVLGFGKYSSEKDIVKKLGEPSNISINEEGTEKILSYPKWNAAFEFEKGNVKTVCVTDRPNVRYSTEYGENKDAKKK